VDASGRLVVVVLHIGRLTPLHGGREVRLEDGDNGVVDMPAARSSIGDGTDGRGRRWESYPFGDFCKLALNLYENLA
jgi:hypothetical protein